MDDLTPDNPYVRGFFETIVFFIAYIVLGVVIFDDPVTRGTLLVALVYGVAFAVVMALTRKYR
jgi:uncharacterized membrane protein YczE